MKYLDKLKALGFPEDQFAVFGSGPMAIRGFRENDDVDIVVKEALWEDLVKHYPHKDNAIEIGHIEVWKDWKPWFKDVDYLIDTADEIEGVRFVKLEHVLEWKKKLGRDKDKRDVELIEAYLEI